MKSIDDMKIYIVEYDERTANIFKEAFKRYPKVTVVNEDLYKFFSEHQDEIECIVSPANAFGHMDGGFDARISDILGWDFQLKVQAYIKENFGGEQIVGTSFIIKTNLPHLSLIHTPTMRYPSKIYDPRIIEKCMRSTLECASDNDIGCMIIPVFGGSCGGIDPELSCELMRRTYFYTAERIRNEIRWKRWRGE